MVLSQLDCGCLMLLLPPSDKLDFLQLQEQIWKKFDRTVAFTSRPLFPSDTQLDYVVTNIQNKLIYLEASLRNFKQDTVDNVASFVIYHELAILSKRWIQRDGQNRPIRREHVFSVLARSPR